MLYELANLSVHNLMRARARLLMTAGGVMIGTTAVVLLIALTIGLQSAAEASIGDTASLTQITIRSSFRRDSSSPTLDNDAVTQLKALPDVASVTPILQMSGQIELHVGNDNGSAQVYGIDPATLSGLGLKASSGTLALDATQPYVGVAGSDVPTSFVDEEGAYVTSPIDLTAQAVEMRVYSQGATGRSTRKINLQVGGVLESGTSYDSVIILPLSTVMDLNDRISGSKTSADELTYSQIIVQSSSRETAASVMTAITDLGYNATGMGSYLSQLNSFFNIMRLMLGGVGAVALLVAAFGVANTMTMAILERTREIGLMKAVGASDREVLTIFLIEAGMVGLSGGVAGLTLSYLLQFAINALTSGGSSSGSTALSGVVSINLAAGTSLVVIPIELSLFALVLATCIGVFAGLYPALRAARMLPVLALKSD